MITSVWACKKQNHAGSTKSSTFLLGHFLLLHFPCLSARCVFIKEMQSCCFLCEWSHADCGLMANYRAHRRALVPRAICAWRVSEWVRVEYVMERDGLAGSSAEPKKRRFHPLRGLRRMFRRAPRVPEAAAASSADTASGRACNDDDHLAVPEVHMRSRSASELMDSSRQLSKRWHTRMFA